MTDHSAGVANLQGREAGGQVVFDLPVGALEQLQGQVVEVFEGVGFHHAEVGGGVVCRRLARQVQQESVDRVNKTIRQKE